MALLLVNAGQVLTDDTIVATLWGDANRDSAVHSLRTAASRLRRALESRRDTTEVLSRASGGYRLDPSPDAVDSSRFVTMVGDATRRGNPGQRATLLRAALGLWRGPALVELTDLEFARTWANRLESHRLDATEALLVARYDTGESRSLVAELEQLAAEHPLREGLWRLLMLALHGAGRSSEAVRTARRARRALSSIGLEPGPHLREAELSILRASDRHAGLPADDGSDRHPLGLPSPSTTFVGRRAEREDLATILRTARLVTLTGPSGVGKSRLGLEVARCALPAFDDGVHLVDLHDVGAMDAAHSVIASTLGSELSATQDSHASPTWLLVELRSRQLLLLLDGCDHLPSLGELVWQLVSSCPQVVVLATSRCHLGVTGEVVRRLAPLGIPNGVDDSGSAEALDLFVDRARAVSPDFELTPDNVAVVTDIVSRLDGLPFAIEVVASWAGQLPLAEMSRRLGSLLRVGSQARGPNIVTTLPSLYDELSPGDRAVFDSISVLGKSWSVATAEAICNQGDVASSLGRLVDESFLELHAGHDVADARYTMLRLVRELGRAHLRASGRLETLRSRHADHFAAELGRRFDDLWGPRSKAATEWFQRSTEDLDSAHRWLSSADPHRADLMFAAAGCFWIELGYPGAVRSAGRDSTGLSRGRSAATGRATLVEATAELLRLPTLGRRFALPLVATDDRPAPREASVPLRGHHRELAEEALDRFRHAGHAEGIASAQLAVALALGCDGLFAEASAHGLEARAHLLADDNPRALAFVDLTLANLALGDGDEPAAADRTAQARAFLRDERYATLLTAWSLDTSARLAFLTGQPDEAMACWSAVADLEDQRHPRRAMTMVLLATAEMARDHYDAASDHLLEALSEASRAGARAISIQVRAAQGLMYADLGDAATARLLLEEALVRAHRYGVSPARPSSHLAAVTVLDRDYDAATRHAVVCLRAPGAAHDHPAVAGAFEALAACAMAEGRHRRAAVLSGAAEPLRATSFLPRSPLSAQVVALVGPSAGRSRSDERDARGLGGEIELASAIDYAVSGRDTPPASAGADAAVA